MEISYHKAIIAAVPALMITFSCHKESDLDTVTPETVPDIEWTDINEFIAKGDTQIIEQPEGTFMRHYWPDGKLIPVEKEQKWQLFWSEATDALTTSKTPFPEDHISLLTDESRVWGKQFSSIDGFNDGGSWFIGIFPLDKTGHYVGFFHAESHWPGDGTAYKSIGVVYSDDFGETWHDPQQIIADETAKPSEPEWGGLGDACVIWDDVNSRYICYYQAKSTIGTNALCMAMSQDRKGSPGSWKKWDGKDFTLEARNPQTGLGGPNVAIANLRRVAGANPSVMWNKFLEKWVMVYGSWTKSIYISFSNDGIKWDTPMKILGNDFPAWYPNLIGSEGDLVGGEYVKLYWSHNQDNNGIRDIAYCWIKFKKQI